jgi:D-sedoheptulose 7-phosphate isomerase
MTSRGSGSPGVEVHGGAPAAPSATAIGQVFAARAEPVRDLAGQAEAVARACHAMAVRFHQGGKLVVFGTGTASTDAQHVAVEFVHPVIVGKRALPAISLTTDVATVTGVAARDGMGSIFAHQIYRLGEPADIALGISAGPYDRSVRAGLDAARQIGMLTIALTGQAEDPGGGPNGQASRPADAPAESAGGPNGQASRPADAPAGPDDAEGTAWNSTADHVLSVASADPRVIKEVQVTTYHILWELVHVFFEQPGVLSPGVVA